MDIRVTNSTPRVPSKSSFSGTVFEVIFLLIVIIIGYFYLVAPKQKEYSSVNSNLQDLKNRQTNLDKQKEAFDKLIQQLESQSEGVASLEETLPLDNKPSRLYVLLENLMQRSSLTTGSVSVDADTQVVVAGNKSTAQKKYEVDHKVKPTNISVSATGTIDQLTQFLQLVETSTRLLEVTTLDLSQGRGDEVIFKLGMKAYSYSPDPAAATAAAITPAK